MTTTTPSGKPFDGPNNADQDASLSLAVIGGGIAGLTFALSMAFHCPNIPITIYEAAHKFGEIGAGVAFGPNAVKAMHSISPKVKAGFEKVRTSSLDKENVYFTWHVGMDGDEEAQKRGVKAPNVIIEQYIKEHLRGYGEGMVHRAAFLDQMIQLVPETVKVAFGKRLIGIDDEGEAGVVLKFKDGTSARHAAVVGCDGIKSQTRIDLLGEHDPAAHATFTGKYCYRGLIPMEEAIEVLGREKAANACMYLGYHGHLLTFPVEHGKTMNVVAFASSDKWESSEWVVHADRKKLYEDFEGWGETVQKIIRLMRQPDIWALFNDPPAKTYYKGRVAAAGDAAHATTPHHGSGAGMAVEDGYLLSMVLKHISSAKDYEPAFAAYDKIRKPRTQRLVTSSAASGRTFDFEDPDLSDNIEKLAANLNDRQDWIWDYDIEKDIAEAVQHFEGLKSQ